MAVTNIPTIIPLSRNYTYEQIASEVMVLTNTTDNEQIQLFNIRNHININIVNLANILNLSTSPWYRIALTSELENDVHESGLDWIDLSEPIQNQIPAVLLLDVKRVSTVGNSNPTDWINNCTRLDISELTALRSNQNVQWRYSIAWSHTGSEIVLFIGDGISSAANTEDRAWKYYDVKTQKFMIWGTRKPMQDALLAPDDTNGNYKTNIDLPDQYVDLLVKTTQKKVLEQRREQGGPVDAALMQEVNQSVMMLQQQLQNELQFEASEREKRAYGSPQRVPGAV